MVVRKWNWPAMHLLWFFWGICGNLHKTFMDLIPLFLESVRHVGGEKWRYSTVTSLV